MNEIPDKYQKIHEQTYNNKELLKKMNKCVCIQCGQKYDFDEIEQFAFFETAICPWCSVDAVVPLIWDGKELTDEEIEEMFKYWFGR